MRRFTIFLVLFVLAANTLFQRVHAAVPNSAANCERSSLSIRKMSSNVCLWHDAAFATGFACISSRCRT